jgi:hypothetical protein
VDADTRGGVADDSEERDAARAAGRENITEIDNLPPSVSIGPPKS